MREKLKTFRTRSTLHLSLVAIDNFSHPFRSLQMNIFCFPFTDTPVFPLIFTIKTWVFVNKLTFF